MMVDPKIFAIQVATTLEPCDVDTLLADADCIVAWLLGEEAEEEDGEAEVVFVPDAKTTLN